MSITNRYAYYERTEPMFSNVLRDAELVDFARDAVEPLTAYLAEAADALARGRTERGRRRQLSKGALRHALAFSTWRAMTANGIGRADAVRLMAALAEIQHAELILAHVHPLPVAISGHQRDRLVREMRQTAWTVMSKACRACPVPAASVVTGAFSPARGLSELAEQRKADLIVIGAPRRTPLERALAGDTARAALPTPYAYTLDWQEVLAGKRALAQDALRERLDGLDVPVTGDALVGSAPEVLEAASRDADLLVLGSRGFGPVRRLLVGSTVEAVAGRVACPLVVLARPGADDEAPAAQDVRGVAAVGS